MCNSNECRKKRCEGMWKIFALIVGTILIYWFILFNLGGSEDAAVHLDPMNKIVFTTSFLENCCSWWPISHFILFTIIGFLFPSCDVMAIAAGIGWELAEVGVYHAMKKERQGVRRKGSNKIEYSSSWWNGSFKDIFMDIAGFYVGKSLNKIYGKAACFQSLNNCACIKKNDRNIEMN